MNRLFVTVEDITAVMAAGYTIIRVYTDTTSTGTFATLDGTITLVAGAESYDYTDLNGTSATWYKTAYYGAGPGEGTKSAAMLGESRLAYGTVIELRNLINLSAETDDWELAGLLEAAARSIDRYCNRPDGFMADDVVSYRYYTGTGTTVQRIDECVSISEVAVKDSPSDTTYTAWDSPTTNLAGDGDWIAFSGDQQRPDFNGLPYTALMVDPNGDYSTFTSGVFASLRGFPVYGVDTRRSVPTVRVSAYWGFYTTETVPDDIREANVMLASRWYKRLQSSMADTMASPDLGTLMFRQSVDPDIAMILKEGRYIRPAVGRRY